ncbi:MAG: tetratricopeptide repeat protein [Chitinispirillaceae bacterium]|nr:tetratricopeptide repeat protein [Chitinispirillaceae bacterium]
MKTMPVRTLLLALIAAAGVLPCLAPGGSFAKNTKTADVWLVRENMAKRFGAEWYKIGMLHNELNSLSDVLADLRDFELFPADLTGLDKTNLIRFDRKIERLEKEHALLSRKVDAFKQPLLDAMSILREMVVRQPVESMFELLERGDMQRIADMLTIKHQIDTLWRRTDTLLTSVMIGTGFSAETSPPKSETEEFFAILKANLGQQSDHYYKKLAAIKDSLVNRASDRHMREMFAVESHRIKRYVKENKSILSERKISEVETRYQGKTNLSDLMVLAARISLLSGNYEKTLVAAGNLPQSGTYPSLKTLYRLQSHYALHRYDSVWHEAREIDVTQWKGARRNLAVWIIMESALELGEKGVYVKLASLIDRSAPYALHVMHALGRSYLRDNDPGTALSIFEGAMKFTPRTDMDRLAAREVRLAIAQTNYELGRFEKSLSLFFELLGENAEFERALQGILWCYLSLGMNEKAETTLRKLINQSPESRYAAEAFLVLAKHYLYKAQYEWKKILYLTREEQRLKDLIERINRKLSFDTALVRDKKVIAAKKDLTQLLGKLRAEPRNDYPGIASYYESSKRITDLINAFYTTGSFQRVAFTEKREQLLHFLDSVMLAATTHQSATQTARTVSNRSEEISAIKTIVVKSSFFSVETAIERFRFEQEYLNWQKSQLNYYAQETLRPLLPKADSASQAKAAKHKKQFARILDSLLLVEDTLKKNAQAHLTRLLQTQLAGTIDSTDAAYFHYQLGELYYAGENNAYSRDFERFEKEKTAYEKKMALFREGKHLEMPKDPPPPRVDHAASMQEFRNVFRLFPDAKTAAATHYSMAWCFNDLGRFDSALASMETVANSYPDCPFAAQALMYAGEYYFDKGNLSKAIQSYQAAMKYPESEWFEKALYKLAWSQYRLSNPEKAISSFLALAELGAAHGGEGLLERESMDYIAISFSEADMTGEKGLERATMFAKKLGNPDRGSQILHRLAQVYKDQGRYDISKKAYRTLLKMNPAFRNMPGVENEFLATLERDVTPEEAPLLKIEFWKKYHKGSTWSKAQSDPEAIALADSLAEKQLYEATISFHQLALQKNDTTAYTRALDVYTEFIRAYPRSPRASECHYNLAEIEFSLGNYLKAAEEYIAVSKRYPDSKLRETAAWNAIVASQNNLKKEGVSR